MNDKEILQVFTAGQYVYPSFFAKTSKTDLDGISQTWATFFKDVDAVTFAKAFNACAYSCTFFPSIAEVQAQIVMLTQPEELTEQEAWSRVRKVMAYGYYDNDKAWSDLPEICQRAVGSKSVLRDWSVMDMDQVNTVIASNFMRSFRVLAAREEKYKVLPSPIRDQIKALADKKSVGLVIGEAQND